LRKRDSALSLNWCCEGISVAFNGLWLEELTDVTM